jgi:hypothetical protein
MSIMDEAAHPSGRSYRPPFDTAEESESAWPIGDSCASTDTAEFAVPEPLSSQVVCVELLDAQQRDGSDAEPCGQAS